MRKDITIAAEGRTSRGKNEARRLRVSGRAPAIIYGTGKDPVACAIIPKEVSKILLSSTGHNTIFDLTVDGGAPEPVMIVDWLFDPVTNAMLHIDMLRIDLTKPVFVKVKVHVHGEPKGVKQQGGVLEIVAREVEIECLPDDVPADFSLALQDLEINQAIRAQDLVMVGSMKLAVAPDTIIVHIVAPKIDAAAAAAAAEPEVIKKGKKDDKAATKTAAKTAAPAPDAKAKKK